jgi:hypothetical protein
MQTFTDCSLRSMGSLIPIEATSGMRRFQLTHHALVEAVIRQFDDLCDCWTLTAPRPRRRACRPRQRRARQGPFSRERKRRFVRPAT